MYSILRSVLVLFQGVVRWCELDLEKVLRVATSDCICNLTLPLYSIMMSLYNLIITVLDHTQYSADIYFLHQSTVRLTVPGCTNTHGVHVKIQAKHTNDSCSESKLLRLIVGSSTHPCPENWVVIGRTVVYYTLTSRAFSAGIKCRHCTYIQHYDDTGMWGDGMSLVFGIRFGNSN